MNENSLQDREHVILDQFRIGKIEIKWQNQEIVKDMVEM